MNIIESLSGKELVFGVGSLVSMNICEVIAHEYSHMTAMRILFPNLNPYMSCNWSACHANFGGIPELRDGLSITYDTAYGIIAAAGPILDITHVAISSAIAWKARHSNKKISLLFGAHACIFALSTFTYCISTQGSNWGDFAAIESRLGISHNIQTAITGTIALGVTMLMTHIFSKNRMKVKEKN